MLISESQILTALRTSLNSTSLHHQLSSTSAALRSNNAAHGAHAAHAAHAAPSVAKVKSYPIQLLDTLVSRHLRATQSAPLSLSGRYLPLIYLLVATLISSPQQKTVVIIDVDARFDITRVLQCTPHQILPAPEPTATGPDTPCNTGSVQLPKPFLGASGSDGDRISVPHERRVTLDDLRHVHIYRPGRGSPSHIRDVLSSAEQHMIYSKHASIAREWWGNIVIGGGSPTALGPGHADVTTGWKGWLRVDKDEVRGFPVGMSIEEALVERAQRQRAADATGFTASCVWGNFTFSEARGENDQH